MKKYFMIAVAILTINFSGMIAMPVQAAINMIKSRPGAAAEEVYKKAAKVRQEAIIETLASEQITVVTDELDYIEADIYGISPTKDQEVVKLIEDRFQLYKTENMKIAHSVYYDPSVILYAIGDYVSVKNSTTMMIQVNKKEVENKYLIQITPSVSSMYNTSLPTDPDKLMSYIEQHFTNESMKSVGSNIGQLWVNIPNTVLAEKKAADFCKKAMTSLGVTDYEVSYTYINEDGT